MFAVLIVIIVPILLFIGWFFYRSWAWFGIWAVIVVGSVLSWMTQPSDLFNFRELMMILYGGPSLLSGTIQLARLIGQGPKRKPDVAKEF